MEYTSEQIITKLKSYTHDKRRLLLLEYELSNLKKLSPLEMMETMAYRKSMEELISENAAPQQSKVLHIALSYKENTDKQNLEAYYEILEEWQALYLELHRLETYLGLLDDQPRQILQYVFFERKSWKELEEEIGLSRRTINRRKKDAVEALVEMYSYTKKLTDT